MSVVYLTCESGYQHLQPVSPVVKEKTIPIKREYILVGIIIT